MIDDEVGAHTSVTVFAYWKFESVSLQGRVQCELPRTNFETQISADNPSAGSSVYVKAKVVDGRAGRPNAGGRVARKVVLRSELGPGGGPVRCNWRHASRSSGVDRSSSSAI